MPYHRLSVSLWTAESLKYDPEIRKHISLEFGRADPTLRMELVGSWRGGSRSILLRSSRHAACQSGGDQSNRHLLPKYLLEKPRDAGDRREAVGILALQQEHEGVDNIADGSGLHETKRSNSQLSRVAKRSTECGLYLWSIMLKTVGLSRMSVWSCF